MTGRNKLGAVSAALAAICTVGALPGAAVAQDDNRQTSKNNWRNMILGAGTVAGWGILKKDPTIAFAGGAGALYSLDRYEQDRKSQDEAAQSRASIFSRSHVYRNGKRYDRQTVTKDGKQYYRFVRGS